MYKSIAVSAVLVVTGCGGGSAGDSGNPDSIDYSHLFQEDSIETTLDGTWVKSCGLASERLEIEESYYDNVSLKLSGTSFISAISSFSDSDCSDSIGNIEHSGLISYGNQITTSEGVDATEINFHIADTNTSEYNRFEFTIYSVTGNTLYLGDTFSGNLLTPNSRPSKLNYNRAFILQP